MFNWLFKNNNDNKKSCCEHKYKIVDKVYLYRQDMDLFKSITTTYYIDPKDVKHEIKETNNDNEKEDKKNIIGIYVLSECEKCGDLKELKRYF